ncbi:hypothetical protein ACVBEG_26755 [Pseudomonas sp. GG8]
MEHHFYMNSNPYKALPDSQTHHSNSYMVHLTSLTEPLGANRNPQPPSWYMQMDIS